MYVEAALQVTCCCRMFDVGCPLQIRAQIITLLAKTILTVLASGLRKPICSKNGRRLAPFFGYMAYVRVFPSFLLAFLVICYVVAGSGKSILWYVSPYC